LLKLLELLLRLRRLVLRRIACELRLLGGSLEALLLGKPGVARLLRLQRGTAIAGGLRCKGRWLLLLLLSLREIAK
jgi:hypothetical protein